VGKVSNQLDAFFLSRRCRDPVNGTIAGTNPQRFCSGVHKGRHRRSCWSNMDKYGNSYMPRNVGPHHQVRPVILIFEITLGSVTLCLFGWNERRKHYKQLSNICNNIKNHRVHGYTKPAAISNFQHLLVCFLRSGAHNNKQLLRNSTIMRRRHCGGRSALSATTDFTFQFFAASKLSGFKTRATERALIISK